MAISFCPSPLKSSTATAIPNVRDGRVVGYTSVRRKPSRSKVNECIALYARMRAEELK